MNTENAADKTVYRVLVVEDDPGIAAAVCAHASAWGFEAESIKNFEDIMPEFSAFDPHILLLDISLPFYDGYYWCGKIRSVSKIPIIFISCAHDGMNIIMAMNMGADDFIAKPFDSAVLIAKMKALLRRTYDFGPAMPVICHRGLMLNTQDTSAVFGEKRIELSKNEYRILLELMENRGRVVSRERLMERLWQTDSFVDENTLTVNVNRLRKKLSEIGIKDFISTRFGVGYIVL